MRYRAIPILRLLLIGKLLILPLLLPSASAEVYRCPTPEGDTLFSDTPCPDGERLDVSPHPSTDAEPQGLRPAERELLERLQKRDSVSAPDTVTAVPTDHARCSGIRILSVEAFNRTSTVIEEIDGFLYRTRIVQQCARVELQTTAYYGRLRDSVAEALQRRLRARFSDGSWQAAREGELTDAPRRFGVRETVTGSFCFGPNDTPMIRVECD